MTTAIEVNCTTGEVVERPLTQDELAQREADAVQAEADRLAAEAEAQAKAALKDSARAKLVAGEPLTADEAALLVL
jgi:hypothetical protein